MKSGYCTIRWNGRDCGTSKMNHCQSYQRLVFIQRRWCSFGEIGSPLLWASSRRPIISNKYCSKLEQIKAALGKKYLKLVNRKHLIFYHACVISHFSHVWLFATLWTVTHQAHLSMEFSRQEYWSGWPCPPPRDYPDPGIKPTSLMYPALAGRFFTTSSSWEAH